MDAVNIALALVLVGANGFFVATEFAVARLRPGQVEKWVSDGRPGAKSVKHAIEHIDSYLAACQLGITISSPGPRRARRARLPPPARARARRGREGGRHRPGQRGLLRDHHAAARGRRRAGAQEPRDLPHAADRAVRGAGDAGLLPLHEADRRPLQRHGEPAAQAVRHPARPRGRPRAGQRGRAALAPARERGGRRDRGGGAALHRERADLRRPARARGDDAARPDRVRHHRRELRRRRGDRPRVGADARCRCARPTRASTRPSACCTSRTCSSAVRRRR